MCNCCCSWSTCVSDGVRATFCLARFHGRTHILLIIAIKDFRVALHNLLFHAGDGSHLPVFVGHPLKVSSRVWGIVILRAICRGWITFAVLVLVTVEVGLALSIKS